MHDSWQKSVLWALVGGFVGLAVGFLLGSWEAVDLEAKVNLSDLFQAAGALLITVFVGYVLRRREAHNRVEKERLISTIGDAREAIARAEKSQRRYSNGEIELAGLNADFKRLSNSLIPIEDQLRIFDFGAEKTFQKAENAMLRYRQEVTGAEDKDPQSTPDQVKSWGQEERRELQRNLEMLIRKVNRA